MVGWLARRRRTRRRGVWTKTAYGASCASVRPLFSVLCLGKPELREIDTHTLRAASDRAGRFFQWPVCRHCATASDAIIYIDASKVCFVHFAAGWSIINQDLQHTRTEHPESLTSLSARRVDPRHPATPRVQGFALVTPPSNEPSLRVTRW